MQIRQQPFSWTWVIISMVIFVGFELLIGGLLGGFLQGRYRSLSTSFLIQGTLNLASYFIGGLLIGLISPRVRINEPAVGAFLAVALMMALTIFTPYSFIRFSLGKLVVGGIIAFALALTGAKLGEKLTGNL